MKRIYFFYPKGERLTGQEAASKMIFEQMGEDWDFKLKTFPAFERSNQGLSYYFLYFLRIFKVWCSVFSLAFVRKPIVYINLGQSLVSIFRDGVPFIILSWIRWDMRCVVSLHGHVFTTWKDESLTRKLFRAVLKKAEVVTVLGDVQKNALNELGIGDHKAWVVNNTCDIKPKSLMAHDSKVEKLRLLYLSNLIKTKGYQEYLESLKLLSENKALKFNIEAVLCGRITISGTSDQEENETESRAWIEAIIKEINESSKVSVKWIEGAYGEEKQTLFKEADLFVFPSRYPVEAQPIVLLEAMASGTAIVTSKVGEIPSTVTKKNAILIDIPDAANIASVIEGLAVGEIQNLKAEGILHYSENFSHEVYMNNWQKIFCKISNTVNTGNKAYCDLNDFDNHDFNRGRPFFVELAWVCSRGLFFSFVYLPIYGFRRFLLRFFGAEIGQKVVLKPASKVTFPWRLSIGDNTWIGEESWILNLEHVTIGDNVIISQRALICTGNHNWAKPRFDLIVKPVVIENGVWIGADVTVLPGVKIGANSVVTAGSVVSTDLPTGMICSGNPCKPIKPREFNEAVSV